MTKTTEDYRKITVEETLEALETDGEKGLSEEEAKRRLGALKVLKEKLARA